jgi:hypothetical protein
VLKTGRTFLAEDCTRQIGKPTMLKDSVDQPDKAAHYSHQRGYARANNPEGFRGPHHQLRTSQFVETRLSTETVGIAVVVCQAWTERAPTLMLRTAFLGTPAGGCP